MAVTKENETGSRNGFDFVRDEKGLIISPQALIADVVSAVSYSSSPEKRNSLGSGFPVTEQAARERFHEAHKASGAKHTPGSGAGPR